MLYLKNVQLLLPRCRQPLAKLLLHLGERCTTLKDRLCAFSTVFAFYFAAINLFCFYVAYANSLVNNLPALDQLPPFPAAVCITLALITMSFVLITYVIQNRIFAQGFTRLPLMECHANESH
jgi:hypothetical protein